MDESDFYDPHYNRIAVENTIGFRWGLNVHNTLPGVFVAPQVRTLLSEHTGRGAKPLIDYLFNGLMNMGMELILNQPQREVVEHLKRFDNEYKRYKDTGSGYLFHFLTNSNKPWLTYQRLIILRKLKT